MVRSSGPRQERERRRRWLAAGGVSAAVHGLVILSLALTTPHGGPAPEPPVFEVTLERPGPPAPALTPRPAERQAARSAIRLHQPPAIVPGAPTSGLPAAAGATPSPGSPGPTASAPPATNPKLTLDCLHLGPRAKTGVYGREDCEVQRYAKTPGSDQVFGVPANPVWDAQVADRMRKHEPLPRGQEPRMDCPGANLGLGCSDEALSYSTKRKF